MKTILFFIAVFSIVLGLAFRETIHTESALDFDCIGPFCSCDVNCEEGEVIKCRRGIFSCECWCEANDPKGVSKYSLASMNAKQEHNLTKAEDYFRNLSPSKQYVLADAIRGLREALTVKNLANYQQHGKYAEIAFESMSEAEKKAWNAWSGNNLLK